jgi:uncharacterized protein (TIGR00299 family) protein
MRILYFDAFAGLSGDMTVGALLALGVGLDALTRELGTLALSGYRLRATSLSVHGIGAIKFDVDLDAPTTAHAHRRYRDIRAMLEASGLRDGAKRRALAIFARLASAESAVHRVPLDEVAFHEVGAVDSIVDIAATAIALDLLDVERVYASVLPLGSGTVHSQHGVIPVPAPATVELLRGLPVRLGDGSGEMVTPTGAAIVAACVTPGEAMPALQLEAVGYGAGTRLQPDRPNVLRLLLASATAVLQTDELVEVAATIDDASPELYAHALQAVFDAGARDAWLVPAQMKKQRPGVVLHALVDAVRRPAVAAAILRETTAIGLRFHAVERLVLPRRHITVETRYGAVLVKVAESPDGTANLAPEYEDCRRLAIEHGVALKVVYQAAIAAAVQLHG